MKKLTLTLVACLCGLSQEVKSQNNIIFGCRISSLLTDQEAEISIGHGFSRHWSVGGSAALDLSSYMPRHPDEVTDHYAEFDMVIREERENSRFAGDLKICYWPEALFNGTYFAIGGRFGERKGFDCRIGLGYAVRIWRNLGAELSYHMDLISSYDTRSIDGSGLSIGINLIF